MIYKGDLKKGFIFAVIVLIISVIGFLYTNKDQIKKTQKQIVKIK